MSQKENHNINKQNPAIKSLDFIRILMDKYYSFLESNYFLLLKKKLGKIFKSNNILERNINQFFEGLWYEFVMEELGGAGSDSYFTRYISKDYFLRIKLIRFEDDTNEMIFKQFNDWVVNTVKEQKLRDDWGFNNNILSYSFSGLFKKDPLLFDEIIELTDLLILAKEDELTDTKDLNVFKDMKAQYEFVKYLIKEAMQENQIFSKYYPLLFKYIMYFKEFTGKPSNIDFFGEISKLTKKTASTIERTYHNYKDKSHFL